MVVRKGGYRRKTRHLMKKKDSGRLSLTKFFASFKQGDNVALVAEPAYQKAPFHLRFFGKHAIVQRSRGECYEVTIKDGGKIKTIITHPIHLKRLI